MNINPVIPPAPVIDHGSQSKLAMQVAAMLLTLRKPLFDRGKHMRSGVTKNKGRRRNKARALMARESRRRNRS